MDADHGAGRPLSVVLHYPAAVHGTDDDLRAVLGDLESALPPGARVTFLDSAGSGSTSGPEVAPEQVAAVADADAAMVLDDPCWMLDLAPCLRWVQTITTGVDHVDLESLGRRGLRLTTAAGTSSVEIAEFVLARILEHWKRLPEIAEAQRERRWQAMYGRPLAGSTAVLVGYGAINRAVARLLAPFGVDVVVVRRRAVAEPDGPAPTVVGLDGLDEVLGRADLVVAALPATGETAGMFDGARFARMRRGAFFCNVGRGSAVVEADLAEHLGSGHLGGAAVDVTSVEPLPADDPLWASPVRVSGHCSSVPARAVARVHELFARNVPRFLAGEPMENEVDLAS